MARTRLYRDGDLEAEDFPVADISDHLADPTAVVWLDMAAPTEDDFATIGEELGLHRLAVEDALHAQQRPKVDRYDTHGFLNAYAVHLDTPSGELQTIEVSAFITEQTLVTVRKSDDFDIDAVVQRWDDAEDLAGSGVGYLVHGLLDYVVDSHFDAVQQRRSLRLRKSLVTLRRVDYQDVYDHVLRASEWTESLRDLVATIRDTQLNIQGNRLNTIMKQVTSWAAIIAVPTAITGFYGQNIPYPGLQQPWGFWTSTIAILALSGGLYTVFKRRGWL
ncbi:magnesium transporter CorA family protein [Amycolatopsis sp. DG1A-15b]|uniref:magnesium transporter CorA family protein n=1 Tax=Amycolatopsis sp. DG1A-15b TaxID=3052846 RepID=UPI00255B785E|nr:magnesium transporter CorA family protein [Amycolatopsis sp. DG1A-15b]WIX87142.1 magnesium transporter CorA family protein [Amycolatopsis sp. DG1A-15b]